ncbi:MAG: DUF4266 domain-containing protein [Saprospiraceae bacterium]|nr:DUF4266 domain-containing protein [Saprospiraceae bacterium]MCB0543610.1 DUF4266 domain-containing protein [Saprospiraceae bacterium]MCB0577381.1 DUF4266 domain-containing protein [Saprospiraceae bacterium]MCB9305546.1 DUF4266 domain-containing protein [Lewinellaceae bacterium]MCB9355058.1 DUF4266 domain-containing protein [Lewinellaceae bacterium]
MKIRIPIPRLLFACGMLMCLFACQNVKPYQRTYLNDRDMKVGTAPAVKYENNAQAYREGAAGGGSGKSGGGCGCN